MNNHIPTKKNEVANDQLLISGIQKHFASGSIILNGTSYTGPALVSAVQARLSAVNATIAAKATWQAAVKAEDEELLTSQSFLNALRKSLYTMFTDINDLADFGLKPHKKPALTPAERVVAAAKAKATREARHTMGAVQKKAIKGTAAPPATGASSGSSPVTPVASAPVAAPVVPVAAASPPVSPVAPAAVASSSPTHS
jgi:hypothetical protein